MNKLTHKEKILKVMEWDIPFHLTELSEKTRIEYSSISQVIDELLRDKIIERYSTGTYIKFSKQGKVKYEINQTIKMLKYKEKCILKLREEYKQLAEDLKELKSTLKELEQD